MSHTTLKHGPGKYLRADADARPTKNSSETAPGGAAAPQETRAPVLRLARPMVRAYERFLELPPAFVLGVMWLAGVALLGALGWVLYSTGGTLVRLALGSA